MLFYNRALGANLRAARQNVEMSLNDVAVQTHDEFKASILGAYERGERAITVERFARLCAVYGVHTASVMPYA